jgi:hypothetical protein
MRILASTWIECICSVVLVGTTLFAYLHENWGTAVIAAVCAGFVGGIAVTRTVLDNRVS